MVAAKGKGITSMTESDFSHWLADNKPNSQSNYLSGVRAVSRDMLAADVIEKPLFEMNRLEYEIAMLKILGNPNFKKKDETGRRMYSNSLKHLQSCMKELSDNVADEKFAEKIISESGITITEKETLIKSRVGQGEFKQKIIEKYRGKCIVTGIACKRILIASHIKPWRSQRMKNVWIARTIFCCRQPMTSFLTWG